MKTKIDKRDNVFSLLVRERVNHTCESCGHYCGPKHENGQLDCSHIFGRANRATRWHPDNAVAQCRNCHSYFTDNPTMFTRWYEIYLHWVDLDALRPRAFSVKKYSKPELEDLYKHLKGEYLVMTNLRKGGHEDRLEFLAFD